MTDRPEFSEAEPDDDRAAALAEFYAWYDEQDGEPVMDFVEPTPIETIDPGDFL